MWQSNEIYTDHMTKGAFVNIFLTSAVELSLGR